MTNNKKIRLLLGGFLLKPLTVAALFDGMSCGQIALDKLDIPVAKYFASEIDKYAIQTTQKNYPETIQLGDVREVNETLAQELALISNTDLLLGGSPCFPAGQQIITAAGFKSIEDIKEGDRVLTHQGRFREVVTPMERAYTGTMYTINTELYQVPIQATDEHPFYTQRGWMEAKNLKKSDFVAFPLNHGELAPKEIFGNIDFIDNHAFWQLVGYTIACGVEQQQTSSFDGSTIELYSYPNPPTFAEEIAMQLDFFIDAPTTDTFTIHSLPLSEVLKAFKRDNQYVINEAFHDVQAAYIESFLAGFAIGNGASLKKGKQCIYCSPSRALIEGLQRLVLKAHNQVYSLHYRAQHTTKTETFSEGVYCLSPCIDSHAKIEQHFVFHPISSISKQKVTDTLVYNCEVAEDNSYCLPFVTVHNCQNLSMAVANNAKHNQGLDGEKSKLFYEYLRVKELLQPKYFFFENVAMKEMDRKIITEALEVEPIELNSLLLSAQDRKRLYWTNIPQVGTPEDLGLFLRDIVLPVEEVPEKYWYEQSFDYHGDGKRPVATLHINGHDILKRVYGLDQKAPTLTCCGGGNTQKKVLQNDRCRKLLPIEYERLQTVPDNYTAGVSDTQRYNMLGNGWNVDTIAFLLQGLKVAQQLQGLAEVAATNTLDSNAPSSRIIWNSVGG